MANYKKVKDKQLQDKTAKQPSAFKMVSITPYRQDTWYF